MSLASSQSMCVGALFLPNVQAYVFTFHQFLITWSLMRDIFQLNASVLTAV